ncbi:ATP-binding protein [Clostridium rectalis]|uniref:ATP-binding protein n=1 Tax=Clostridium rectalis TaxID=2040295 RepID=UPI000F63A293|nr:ATP-binding protein [Clostridium rectalis]
MSVREYLKNKTGGILSNEIRRVFDKRFTGNKGRLNNKSTGIGLYLFKNLCDKLGILINIVSKKMNTQRLRLLFQKAGFVNFNEESYYYDIVTLF